MTKRAIATIAIIVGLSGVAVPQEISEAQNIYVLVSHPVSVDGVNYITPKTWTRIVFGAWDAFTRSGITNVKFAPPPRWWVVDRDPFFRVNVVLKPGRKQEAESSGCVLADVPIDDESVIEFESVSETWTVRFYVGCSIEREKPRKGSPEWVTAMSAILAHEVVHIVTRNECKHGTDPSRIFGKTITLKLMDDSATFSERVVEECFGIDLY